MRADPRLIETVFRPSGLWSSPIGYGSRGRGSMYFSWLTIHNTAPPTSGTCGCSSPVALLRQGEDIETVRRAMRHKIESHFVV
jgi:hypothetical protein